MRILHIFDVCGISSELMDYANAHGSPSRILTTAHNNKFKDSRGEVVARVRTLVPYAILGALQSDAVVLHGNLSLIPYLRFFSRNLFLFAHGSEIRGSWEVWASRLRYVRHVFVSTPDLLEGAPEGFASCIPRPVSSIFVKMDKSVITPRALTFTYRSDDNARAIAKSYGLPLDIRERSFLKSEMPDLFSRYTHYIDVRRDHRGNNLEFLSLTALEALESGLTVLTERGEIDKSPGNNRDIAGRLFLEGLHRYAKF